MKALICHLASSSSLRRTALIAAALAAVNVWSTPVQSEIELSFPFLNTIKEYSTSGSPITSFSGGPFGVALSGSSLFVATGNSGTVSQFTPSGSGGTSLVSGLTTAQDVAVAGSTLYVLDSGAGTLRSVPTSGGSTTLLSSGVSGSYLAASSSFLAVSSSNNGNGFVSIYNPAGSLLQTISGVTWAGGVALVGTDLYIADNGSANAGTDSILRYSYNGSSFQANGSYSFATGGNNLLGMASDGTHLFAIRNNSSGGAVAEFNLDFSSPNLTFMSNLGTGTSGPNYISVSAIPEPSTYAAIGGAAVLAFAMWRRRRTDAFAAAAIAG